MLLSVTKQICKTNQHLTKDDGVFVMGDGVNVMTENQAINNP